MKGHTHLTPVGVFLGVYARPKLLSLSLNESGVEADNEDRDGRDMAMDLDERSRTWHFNVRDNAGSGRKKKMFLIKKNSSKWKL